MNISEDTEKFSERLGSRGEKEIPPSFLKTQILQFTEFPCEGRKTFQRQSLCTFY